VYNSRVYLAFSPTANARARACGAWLPVLFHEPISGPPLSLPWSMKTRSTERGRRGEWVTAPMTGGTLRMRCCSPIGQGDVVARSRGRCPSFVLAFPHKRQRGNGEGAKGRERARGGGREWGWVEQGRRTPGGSGDLAALNSSKGWRGRSSSGEVESGAEMGRAGRVTAAAGERGSDGARRAVASSESTRVRLRR
jgi:hypothetical protein